MMDANDALSGRAVTRANMSASRFRKLMCGVTIVAACLAFAACSTTPSSKNKFDPKKYGVKGSPRVVSENGAVPKGGGRYVVGKPYKIAGKWYRPKLDPDYDKVGLASWYGPTFYGRMTANGEIFDKNALTAAHTTMPLPSYARVTNLSNGRSMIVRVNDRGPFHGNRVIDLSSRVADMLNFKSKGTAKVRVQYVGRARMDGRDQQYLLASYRGPGAVTPGGTMPGTMIAMAKLMTLDVLFGALDKGTVTLETTFPVSEHAWRTGGAPARTTTMFAVLNSEVPVADLIRGIIIQNANDGCIIVAEGLAGSEGAFAERMNERARELGMTHSHFGNATGLPGAQIRTTARGLFILAAYLIKAHPQLYRIFSEEAFTWNGIYQRNRMALFGNSIGIDGLKDGFVEGEGHGVVSSSIKNVHRLLTVVAGLADQDARDQAAVDLLGAGYEQFDTVEVYKANEVVAEARVFGGAESYVPLVSYVPVEMTLLDAGREVYRMRVVYTGPIPAPIKKGQKVGELRLYKGKELVNVAPLFTASEIVVGDIKQRAVDGALELLIGWW
ncbi:septal ring lytic transglycosylase RlpA family protein [Breoghania sp.]|uniref:septal ring lytic transglycosylase RlpA family protein n=1 Tax=Breoghania sp. TaxID=2065378 RepID=UPI002609B1B9|nr:septal ring lytic transglycosylase RlpA family protein [Breoghania sp.]MDJ0930735.1 septal ring lytic transglycosylase RlpA family protein [Breoghania sp.]